MDTKNTGIVTLKTLREMNDLYLADRFLVSTHEIASYLQEWGKNRCDEVIYFLDCLYQGKQPLNLVTMSLPSIEKKGEEEMTREVLLTRIERMESLLFLLFRSKGSCHFPLPDDISVAFDPEDETFHILQNDTPRDPKFIFDLATVFASDWDRESFFEDYMERNTRLLDYQDPKKFKVQLEKIISKLIQMQHFPLEVRKLAFSLPITDLERECKSEHYFAGQFVILKCRHNVYRYGKFIEHTLHRFEASCNGRSEPDPPADMEKPFDIDLDWVSQSKQNNFFMGDLEILVVACLLYGYKDMYELDAELSEPLEKGRFASLRLLEGIKTYCTKHYYNDYCRILDEMGIRGLLFSHYSNQILNFCYALYIYLKKENSYSDKEISRFVRIWIAFSMFTDRYRTPFTYSIHKEFEDLSLIRSIGIEKFLGQSINEDIFLKFSDILEPDVAMDLPINWGHPFSSLHQLFIASQILNNAHALFSSSVRIIDIAFNFTELSKISEIEEESQERICVKFEEGINHYTETVFSSLSNYAFIPKDIKSSLSYDSLTSIIYRLLQQCKDKIPRIGDITDLATLEKNLEENAIPKEILQGYHVSYNRFIDLRIKEIARHIQEYLKKISNK